MCCLIYLVLAVLAYLLVVHCLRRPRIRIEQKTILITGCDSGFGYLLAKRLDHLGFNVIAACLTEAGEESVKRGASDHFKTCRLDVTNTESILNALDFVKHHVPSGKGLWGLVNNAGIGGKAGLIEWMKKEDYQEVMNVNFMGGIEVTRLFLPLLKIARGRVVNVCSVAGRVIATSISAPYCCSKYAFEAYSDSLRQAMSPYGVSVHIIEPGFFKTYLGSDQFFFGALEKSWNSIDQRAREEYGEASLETMKRRLKKFVSSASPNIDWVVDCMEHALTARFPRIRYLVGWDAWLLILPLSLMTGWIQDSFVNILFGRFDAPPSGKKNN